jgi:rsbT co-antagonist protein RsbR
MTESSEAPHTEKANESIPLLHSSSGNLQAHFAPTLNTQELARRQKMLHTLIAVQTGVVILILLLAITNKMWNPTFPLGPAFGLGVAAALVGAVATWLNKNDHFYAASYLFLLFTIALITTATSYFGSKSSIPYFYLWPVVASGIILPGWSSFLFATLSAIIYTIVTLLQAHGLIVPAAPSTATSSAAKLLTGIPQVVLVFYLVALLISLSERSLEQALRQNTERTRELEHTKTELERTVAELRTVIERQRPLVETVRKLSTPVIPVMEGIIIMPIIGHVDEERGQQIVEALLEGINRHRAQVALIDVTGVETVSQPVADVLRQSTQAARLLGAEAILVGLQSEMAQALLRPGVELGPVTTRRDLQSGVEYALQLRERRA